MQEHRVADSWQVAAALCRLFAAEPHNPKGRHPPCQAATAKLDILDDELGEKPGSAPRTHRAFAVELPADVKSRNAELLPGA